MPNCVNCGAPMRLDPTGGLACAHCGAVDVDPGLIPHLEVDGASAVRCPVCGVQLTTGRLDSHPVLLCERCLGMLIGMDVFVHVIEAARAHETPARVLPPRRQDPGDRVLPCPRCTQPMLSHLYGGPGNLVIDTCEACGVNWLDRGELRRIARAPM